MDARRARLVPRRFRVPVALVAVLAAAVVAVLARAFAGESAAGRTDRILTGLVDGQAGTRGRVSESFADLGGPGPIAVALLVLAVLALAARGLRGLALVVLGPPAAMVTTSLVLKPLIDRTHDGGLAFPSGHTTAVASVSAAAGILLLGWAVLPLLVRVAGALGLFLLVAAVGTSLVGQGYHYPTDTVGGLGVALAVVCVVALLVDLVADAVTGPSDPARGAAPVDAPTRRLPAAGR